MLHSKKIMVHQIPLWLKISYTIMVIIIIPIYWQKYGPTNFLWLSDIALITMVGALWLENKLIPSMMAIGVVPLEFLWMLDYASKGEFVGISKYMFDTTLPLYLRALSLFHIPLPFVILYCVYKLGYERKALLLQILLLAVLLPFTYFVAPIKENINWVHGLGEEPQALSYPLLYLLGLFAGMSLTLLPMHFLFRKFCDKNL